MASRLAGQVSPAAHGVVLPKQSSIVTPLTFGTDATPRSRISSSIERRPSSISIRDFQRPAVTVSTRPGSTNCFWPPASSRRVQWVTV